MDKAPTVAEVKPSTFRGRGFISKQCLLTSRCSPCAALPVSFEIAFAPRTTRRPRSRHLAAQSARCIFDPTPENVVRSLEFPHAFAQLFNLLLGRFELRLNESHVACNVGHVGLWRFKGGVWVDLASGSEGSGGATPPDCRNSTGRKDT